MKLFKGFISNDQFIKEFHEIGTYGMSRKYLVRQDAIRSYRKKYVPELIIDIKEIRKRQSAALVKHFNNERRLKNGNNNENSTGR